MKTISYALLCCALFASATGIAQTLAITDATVHTLGPDGTLENATVLVDDGVIVAIGDNIVIPNGATIVDATDKIVTPGLFSPLGQLGLMEVNAVQGTNDATQRGDRFTASFDIADAYNRRSLVVAVSRADGITRAGITPQASAPDPEGNTSNVLSGLGSVVQLGDSGEAIVSQGAVVVANFGETGSSVAGGSRAAAVMVLRTALRDAINYRDNKAAADRGDWRNFSVSTGDLQTLVRVIDEGLPLLCHANRASDIEVVLGLAAEFDINVVIVGGAEAWLVADEIAAANVPVILNGFNNLPGNFDLLNARLDSAAILADAGVQVALEAGSLTPGGQAHNARNIVQAAGITVANGLDWDDALRAITLIPAQIYGVADRVGSVEVGKEADLVVWNADPLELTNYPEQVFIRGEAVSLENRHTLLRDRYLDPDAELPPAFR